MRGELARDQRLPGEADLAREFGVSRGTVREALRLLAAHNLIRTAKGAGGGSFVTLPTADHVSRCSRRTSACSTSRARSPPRRCSRRANCSRRSRRAWRRVGVPPRTSSGCGRASSRIRASSAPSVSTQQHDLPHGAAGRLGKHPPVDRRAAGVRHPPDQHAPPRDRTPDAGQGERRSPRDPRRGRGRRRRRRRAPHAQHLAMLRKTYVRLWTHHGKARRRGRAPASVTEAPRVAVSGSGAWARGWPAGCWRRPSGVVCDESEAGGRSAAPAGAGERRESGRRRCRRRTSRSPRCRPRRSSRTSSWVRMACSRARRRGAC